MSDTAVVKVYGSEKKHELLALIPVGGAGAAQTDEVLIDFAKSQLRHRLPESDIQSAYFKIERRGERKPAPLEQPLLLPAAHAS